MTTHAVMNRIAASLLAIAAVATPAGAKPVPVVDRGPDGPNMSNVDNVRIRNLGDGYFESGSSQFTPAGLTELIGMLSANGYDKDKHHLVIVDLRQEAHGSINGHAVRWMDDSDPRSIKYDWVNLGRDHDQIVKDEVKWLEAARTSTDFYRHPKGSTLEPFKFKAAPSPAYTAMTEAALVDSVLGPNHYIRLTVPDHKMPETDAEVDHFLAELDLVFAAVGPKRPWLHFHCAAGQGRTTTFMALYELYVAKRHRNKPLGFEAKMSLPAFEGYLQQTRACPMMVTGGKGGADLTLSTAYDVLFGLNEHGEDQARGEAAVDRYRFILNFYFFLGSGAKTWTEWARRGGCSLDPLRGKSGGYQMCH